MEGIKIKKIMFIISIFYVLNVYGDVFMYQNFEYMTKFKKAKEMKDMLGEIDIESSITSVSVILKYETENSKIKLKLKEKDRAKIIEITQKYLAWAEVAEKKGMKMDKIIDKMEKMQVIIEKESKRLTINRDITFNLFYYDAEKYYMAIEYTEIQGKMPERIFLNREQSIEMLNKINEEAIKDGIKLHEINTEI